MKTAEWYGNKFAYAKFIPEYSGDRNNCLSELRRCNTHTSMRGASANVTMVDEKSSA